MLFRQIYDATLAQYTYLVGCQQTREALIIDPERDIDRYLEAAASEGMRVTAVTETHIHADFLSGSRDLGEATGAIVYLSAEGDEDWKYKWPADSSARVEFLHGDSQTSMTWSWSWFMGTPSRCHTRMRRSISPSPNTGQRFGPTLTSGFPRRGDC